MSRFLTIALLVSSPFVALASPPTYTYSEPVSYDGHGAFYIAISRHGKCAVVRDVVTGDAILYGPGVDGPLDLSTVPLPNTSQFMSVNDGGQFLAQMPAGSGYYIFSRATMSVTPVNAASSASYSPSPSLINSRGNVGGYEVSLSGHAARSIRWSAGVSKAIFTGPEGSPISNITFDLGDDDWQIGITGPTNGFATFNGFMYKEGAPTIITVPGQTQVLPYAINDNDEVAGWADAGVGNTESFTYNAGIVTILPSFIGGDGTLVTNIDNSGQVLGQDYNPSFSTTVWWDVDGTPYNAMLFLPPAIQSAVAAGHGITFQKMDAYGNLYGYWLDATFGYHAFMLTAT